MVGYLNKVKGGWVLTICAKPCSGEEFNNAEKIPVSGKREAKKICQDRGCTMWTFLEDVMALARESNRHNDRGF